jgi:hypothetical protein
MRTAYVPPSGELSCDFSWMRVHSRMVLKGVAMAHWGPYGEGVINVREVTGRPGTRAQ